MSSVDHCHTNNICSKEFKNFLIQDDGEYICCLFCEVFNKVSEKIDKLGGVLDTVQTRIGKLETISINFALDKEAEAVKNVDKLDDRIVIIK